MSNWFYVQVQETKTWNISIEAKNKTEAENKALELAKKDDPDYTDLEITYVERVKRYVD